MKKITYFLLCVFLTACNTMPQQNIQMSIDTNAPFKDYKSFSVEQFHVDNHFLGLNAFIDKAVINILPEKGLSYSTSQQADLLVRYGVKINHRQTVSIIDWNYSAIDNVPETRVQIEPVHEGSLLVNILERKSGKVVWKASSINSIFSGMYIESITQTQITKAMEEVFENYPSH